MSNQTPFIEWEGDGKSVKEGVEESAKKRKKDAPSSSPKKGRPGNKPTGTVHESINSRRVNHTTTKPTYTTSAIQ